MPERAHLPGTTLGKIKLRWYVLRYLNIINGLIEASSKSNPELLEYVLNQKENASGKLKLAIEPVDNYIENAIETLALVRISRLAVQIQMYWRTQGSIPESLEAISEKVTPDVMTDPCTGQQMFYANNTQSYTIYSTGLDRIDHGGATKSQISETTGQVEKKPDDIGLHIPLFKE